MRAPHTHLTQEGTHALLHLNSPDARLLYRFPKPTPDGRTQILLSPVQLLERLANFIPPPRVHRNRYHGVLAPNAKLRSAVVPIGRPEADAPDGDTQGTPPLPSAEGPVEPTRPASPARLRWAVLLARIYEVLPLLCPACGGEMKILAFLTDPPVVSAILLHLELPHRPPPIAPARGPPQGDFLLDQTPAFDPAEGQPAPEFVFDQSLPTPSLRASCRFVPPRRIRLTPCLPPCPFLPCISAPQRGWVSYSSTRWIRPGLPPASSPPC